MVCLAWNDLIIPHSWCHNPKVPHCSLLPSSDRHSCKYHMHVMKVECSVSCPMKYLKRESSILYFLFFLPILHSHPWIYLSHYRMETFEKVSEGLIKSLSLSPHWISTLINILQPWSWGWNEYPEIITYERPQVSVKLVQSLSVYAYLSRWPVLFTCNSLFAHWNFKATGFISLFFMAQTSHSPQFIFPK